MTIRWMTFFVLRILETFQMYTNCVLDMSIWYHITVYKLFVLDMNTWYITIYKLFVLDINTWYHITMLKLMRHIEEFVLWYVVNCWFCWMILSLISDSFFSHSLVFFCVSKLLENEGRKSKDKDIFRLNIIWGITNYSLVGMFSWTSRNSCIF